MTAATTGPATAVPLAWSRVFAATPAQIREARRFLAGILADSPVADDAILCLSELAANAAIHSRSHMLGGHFTVRAEIRHGDRLRVEVEDQGGPWTRNGIQPEPAHDGPHGRGLVIVGRLARDWGRSGDSETGWTVWFELDCSL
jgi:anti-sigma regulatory factor (Ser/Thr protein kinase)